MIREKFIDRLRKKYQSGGKKQYQTGGMYNQMQQYDGGGFDLSKATVTGGHEEEFQQRYKSPAWMQHMTPEERLRGQAKGLPYIGTKWRDMSPKKRFEFGEKMKGMQMGTIGDRIEKHGATWEDYAEVSARRDRFPGGPLDPKYLQQQQLYYPDIDIRTGEIRSGDQDTPSNPNYKGKEKQTDTYKQTGGMYDQMQQYQMGGEQLPGGEVEPIPGSDAVQFNGQTHDEGGIMMDGQTEVEDGETMDQVNMAKKGGKRDYFFSSYLKTGGRSFANAHKEILAEGGDQQEINMLAKMQEKAAGRDPKQVAGLGGVMKYKHGGTRKYQTGGVTEPVKPVMSDFKSENGSLDLKSFLKAKKQYKKDLKVYEGEQEVTTENTVITTPQSPKYIDEAEDPDYTDEDIQADLARITAEEEEEARVEEEANRPKKKEVDMEDLKARLKAVKKKAKELGVDLNEFKNSNGNLTNKTLESAEEAVNTAQVEFDNKPPEVVPEVVEETPAVVEDPNAVAYDRELENVSIQGGDGGKSSLPRQQVQSIPTTLGEDEETLPTVDAPILSGKNTDRFADAAKDLLNLDIQSLEDAQVAEDNLQFNDETDAWELKPRNTSNLTIDRNPTIGSEEVNLKDEVLGDGITSSNRLGSSYSPEIPNSAYLGMAAGAGAGLYSMFHKQPDAQQSGYTPGFTNPLVAEKGRAESLERFNYNQDIANVGSEVRGMNKYIETSGGGPANMVNKMMAFSKGQTAKNQIRAAETRANIGVQNTEAQLKQQMTLDNMKRAQSASIFNSQMSRAEMARKDQVDEANTARRQKVQDDQEFQKYAGISSFANSLQTGLGDILDYKADMARSQAIGAGAGNVQRDASLVAAGYIPDGKGGWIKGDKTVSKFGGLRRLQNYNK